MPKSVPQVKTASTASPTTALIRSRLATAISHWRSKTACRYGRRLRVETYHSATSRMPRGYFRNGAGTSAMSPNAVPGNPRMTARPLPAARDTAEQMAVRSSCPMGVNSSRFSSGSSRNARIALRVDQQVAVSIGASIEPARRQDIQPPDLPWLPVPGGETENGLGRENGGHIEAEGGGEVVVDPAEHLVRFVDLDGPLLQAVVVPQRGNAGDVHAGDGRAAEVDGDAIGLAMVEGGENALLGGHFLSSGRTRMSGRLMAAVPALTGRVGQPGASLRFSSLSL